MFLNYVVIVFIRNFHDLRWWWCWWWWWWQQVCMVCTVAIPILKPAPAHKSLDQIPTKVQMYRIQSHNNFENLQVKLKSSSFNRCCGSFSLNLKHKNHLRILQRNGKNLKRKMNGCLPILRQREFCIWHKRPMCFGPASHDCQ